jgi:HrpA-like RNA helicase
MHTYFDEGDKKKRPATEPLQNGHGAKRARSSSATEEEETGPRITVQHQSNGKPDHKKRQAKLDAKSQALKSTSQELPVWAGRANILQALREEDTLVILGETGSGKTTRRFS